MRRSVPSSRPTPTLLIRFLSLALLALALPATAQAPSLETAVVRGVEVAETAYRGRPALRVADPPGTPPPTPRLVLFPDSAMTDGALEVWLAAEPAPDAPPQARGFVGLAFAADPEDATYEAFYLRMTNGRAQSQVMRNHASQYVAEPEWGWSRLRDQAPKAYEAYVDLEPGAWTKVRVEVEGDRARLYVHDAPRPTLTVERRAEGGGAVGLWIGPWTVAHFADLHVSPSLD